MAAISLPGLEGRIELENNRHRIKLLVWEHGVSSYHHKRHQANVKKFNLANRLDESIEIYSAVSINFVASGEYEVHELDKVDVFVAVKKVPERVRDMWTP